MPKNRRKNNRKNQELLAFYQESKKIFGERFKETGKPHILIAQYKLEHAVERGTLSFVSAMKSLRNPVVFERMLAEEEEDFRKTETERLHARIAHLEKSTDWKAVAVVSFAVGAVLLIVGPFVNALLLPVVDEVFKRNKTQELETKTQTFISDNSVKNYFSSIYSVTNDNGGDTVFLPLPKTPQKTRKQVACAEIKIK